MIKIMMNMIIIFFLFHKNIIQSVPCNDNDLDKLDPLRNSSDLNICQQDSSVYFSPLTELPSKNKYKDICDSSACVRLLKEAQELNMTSCEYTSNNVTFNPKELINSLVVACQIQENDKFSQYFLSESNKTGNTFVADCENVNDNQEKSVVKEAGVNEGMINNEEEIDYDEESEHEYRPYREEKDGCNEKTAIGTRRLTWEDECGKATNENTANNGDDENDYAEVTRTNTTASGDAADDYVEDTADNEDIGDNEDTGDIEETADNEDTSDSEDTLDNEDTSGNEDIAGNENIVENEDTADNGNIVNIEETVGSENVIVMDDDISNESASKSHADLKHLRRHLILRH